MCLKRMMYVLMMLISGYLLHAFALSANNKAVIHIEADSSIFDYKTGLNVFEGNVKVTQGSTHLMADRLTTKRNKNHQITEAVAYGINQRAKYWTQLHPGQPQVYAEANIMHYYPQDGLLTLRQDVEIKQGKNSFQGELINYNMINKSVHVPASNNARSVLVYHSDEK